MSLEEFKDWLFDVLNDVDSSILADIETKDRLNKFQLSMAGGGQFEIECRKLQGVYGEKKQKTNRVWKDKAIQPDCPADQI